VGLAFRMPRARTSFAVDYAALGLRLGRSMRFEDELDGCVELRAQGPKALRCVDVPVAIVAAIVAGVVLIPSCGAFALGRGVKFRNFGLELQICILQTRVGARRRAQGGWPRLACNVALVPATHCNQTAQPVN